MDKSEYLIIYRNLWEPQDISLEWTNMLLNNDELSDLKNFIRDNKKISKETNQKAKMNKHFVCSEFVDSVVDDLDFHFEYIVGLPLDAVSLKLYPLPLCSDNKCFCAEDDTWKDLNSTPIVYFIRVRDKIKIGKSRRFVTRLYSLQSSNPDFIEVLKFIRCDNYIDAGKLEKQLHKKYSKYNIQGEWFSEDVINDIR